MKCSSCSAEIQDGSRFCENCGAAQAVPPETTRQMVPPQSPGAGSPTAEAPKSTTPLPTPPTGPPYGVPPPSAPPPGIAPGPVPYQRTAVGTRNEPLAIAALAVGIGSLVFMWTPFFSIVLGIAGLVLGIIAMNRIKAQPEELTGRGMALGGLICGISGAVLNVVFLLFVWGFWGTRHVYF